MCLYRPFISKIIGVQYFYGISLIYKISTLISDFFFQIFTIFCSFAFFFLNFLLSKILPLKWGCEIYEIKFSLSHVPCRNFCLLYWGGQNTGLQNAQTWTSLFKLKFELKVFPVLGDESSVFGEHDPRHAYDLIRNILMIM